VRLAHPPAIAPLEVDALPRHLLALLAQLLALARTQAIEEILKIAVAPVEPVELATQALQPAGTPGEQRVVRRLGEVHMPAGQPPLRQLRLRRLQQAAQRRFRAEQAWPGHRREGDRAQALGVVGDAGAATGIGPAPVEDVLAVG